MSEKSSHVGFLWDSLSQNTGDQAIGVTFLRLAHQAGISKVEPVKIGSLNLDRYRSLVIGGGELLQAPGHPYYDFFRIPGPHILNTVGTGGPVEAEYLNDYRLVSARSHRDLENLGGFRGTGLCAPCLTVLFDRIVEGKPHGRRSTGSVGLHLQPATATGGGLEEMIQRLQSDLGNRIVLLPFTTYNCDWLIEEVLAERYDLARSEVVEGPDEAFHAIRALEAVITSSLHATIMAYISGRPFLAFGYAEKVGTFLQERELAQRLVSEPGEVAEKMELLDPESVDWQATLASDCQRAERLSARIFDEIDSALIAPSTSGSRWHDSWSEPTHPVEAHRQMMTNYEEYGRRIAETLRFSGQLAQLERWVESISIDAREGKKELAKASAYCIQLEKDCQEHKQLSERSAAHIQRLETEIGAYRSLQQELEQYGRQLEQEISEQKQLSERTASHVQHLEGEIEAHRSQQQELGQYVRQIENELDHHAAQDKELHDYIAKLENEIGHHTNQEKELRDYVLKLEQDLAAHEEHQKKVSDYVAKLEAEIADYQRQRSQ